MSLPDVRRFSPAASATVTECLLEIQAENLMPPAPTRDGHVVRLRRQLDTSILVALGLTAGQAAAALERIYASYARWRSGLEGVETQMRANRRAMHASGLSRNQSPIESAAKRVWEELDHTVRRFPRQLLASDEVVELVNIPLSATLPATRPLFEEGVIHTKSKTVDLGSHDRVRYVQMLREIGVVGSIEIPTSATKAGAIVDLFEKAAVDFREQATEHALKYVSGRESVQQVVDGAVSTGSTRAARIPLLKQSQNRTKT